MKMLSKALLERYMKRIGKDAFCSSWYYTPNGERWKIAVKAFQGECGAYNLMDKLEFAKKLTDSLDDEKKALWSQLVDKFYVNNCN